jgi:mediator of RNA polymerase II transcription subunit 14
LIHSFNRIGRAPDSVKKAKLQAWLSQAYKQSSKLYVLTKYARNAPDIQKAMDVAAFLQTQGEQIIWATKALHSIQNDSHCFRIRNPDLLTALDVLTTGTYTRLPSRYTEEFVPRPKMSDREVADVFAQVEDLMRMRLLCRDVVPVEMRRWRIEGGRTFFTVPKRFETSLIMTGAQKDDVWAFVYVEFLFGLPEGERKGSRGESCRQVGRG